MSSFNFTERKKTLTSIKNVINAQAAISSWQMTNVSEQVTGFPGDTFCPVSASK